MLVKKKFFWELRASWETVILHRDSELACPRQNGHVCLSRTSVWAGGWNFGKQEVLGYEPDSDPDSCINAEEDPGSGLKLAAGVAILDDLIQLPGTPFFPSASQRWLLIFLY